MNIIEQGLVEEMTQEFALSVIAPRQSQSKKTITSIFEPPLVIALPLSVKVWGASQSKKKNRYCHLRTTAQYFVVTVCESRGLL